MAINSGTIVLDGIVPVSKPRQTLADKWRKRPCVLRYRAYADELRARLGGWNVPASSWHLRFYMPMPKSWSKKKKAAMNEQPHQQKPDKDNLEKAFLDALCEDDSYVWDVRVSKYWSDRPRIEIEAKEGEA